MKKGILKKKVMNMLYRELGKAEAKLISTKNRVIALEGEIKKREKGICKLTHSLP